MSESIDVLLQRIHNEFIEMPGLSLTPAQAARLWHMPAADAESALRRLVDSHVLGVSESGRYCRPSGT
jgi:hypothetical protein